MSQPIDLICKTEANPIANVSWYQLDERNISDLLVSEMANNYKRLWLTEEDDGRFICEASNIHGVVRRELNIMVIKGKVY